MYVIKVDGDLLYSPELMDDGYKVISPKLHIEVNTAGTLDFTLPPCNAKYDAVHKLKSIITVEQDNEEIFRGRVQEESMDIYKQKEIYCEGDLSFLLDSLQAPFSFEGTAVQLFIKLIAVHNGQMDANKQFVVGDVSGLNGIKVDKITTTTFADTSSTVQSLLLDVYGGYIRTRLENGVYYIDYISEYTRECTQKIEFGVNLLDIDSQIDATEFCTVLVPLGATTNNGDALTVADANNGIIYIENADLIARYGRIYRTYTWDQVTDAAQLLKLGQQYMREAMLSETLTLRAVDMHLIDRNIDKIQLGDNVHLSSSLHGIDRASVCTVIDIDLQSGDQSEYTFGLPKQTMSGQAVSTATQLDNVQHSINDQHRWLTETDKALNINVEAINLIGHRTTQLEIDVDAAEEAITLKANQDDMDILETRVNSAEVRISAAESEIDLKASRTSVDEMGARVTAAEVKIDGVESTITLQAEEIKAKADKIDLQGYVTMDDFETVQGWAENFSGVTVSASNVVAGEGDFDVLVVGQLNGESPKWTGGTVVTNFTVTQNRNNATVMLADGSTKWIQWVESVTITPTTAYIEYMGKS